MTHFPFVATFRVFFGNRVSVSPLPLDTPSPDLLFSRRFSRRLWSVPWTARKSSQSILKEINPEYSLEGLLQKLKLQYFGHLMQQADSLGKIEDKRRRGQQRMR